MPILEACLSIHLGQRLVGSELVGATYMLFFSHAPKLKLASVLICLFFKLNINWVLVYSVDRIEVFLLLV